MTPLFESVSKILRQMPGVGHRSAERLALYLLIENQDHLQEFIAVLQEGMGKLRSCITCCNISEEEHCNICISDERDESTLCIVESVLDLHAIERSKTYAGAYHVLGGKLSPIKGIEEKDLNMDSLRRRLDTGKVSEVILALGNDIEGEATCYFIQNEMINDKGIKVSRIGFGLPSGSGVLYADGDTLRSALEGRRYY